MFIEATSLQHLRRSKERKSTGLLPFEHYAAPSNGMGSCFAVRSINISPLWGDQNSLLLSDSST